jgi:Tfp pilus assembly protein PilF
LAQGNNNPFGVSPQEMLRGVDPATVQKLNQFSNALDKNPNDVNALISRAALSLEVADKGLYNFQWILFASKDLEKAIRLDPNNWMARHDYAMACFQAGDVTKAMPNEHLAVIQFTKAIALKPDSARSYMGRGWAYLMLGDEANANADFQKTLQLDPSLRPELTREADAVRGKLAQLVLRGRHDEAHGVLYGQSQRTHAGPMHRHKRILDQRRMPHLHRDGSRTAAARQAEFRHRQPGPRGRQLPASAQRRQRQVQRPRQRLFREVGAHCPTWGMPLACPAGRGPGSGRAPLA